jgi:copper chaperone CopZ
MTHTYPVSGMTCSGCQAKVQNLLSAVPGVKNVQIDLAKGEARLEMDRHIPLAELASALKDHPKYQLSAPATKPANVISADEQKKTGLEIYKPLLIIFGYILVLTLLSESLSGGLLISRWMNHFMAGFFLVFSFFKFLDLKGFAESYSMYDIVAKKWNGWGYLYPFMELALGISFFSGYLPMLTNAVTFVLMSVSLAGVLQSVMNKRKIRCACLGAVFNLPMSTITILEDGLMICMSGVMLAGRWFS